MIVSCLIPLVLCSVAAVIVAGTDRRTLDGIPGPMAAIVGIGCLIWFVASCPWPIELGLVLAVLVLGKQFLQNILNLG